MANRKEGWNWITGSPKWHWFDATGRALCGRWMIFGSNDDAETDKHESPDNCAACRKKVLAKG